MISSATRSTVQRALPSGPTVPPDSQDGTVGDGVDASRWPGAGGWPLSPTPNRYVWPQSHAAWKPMGIHRFLVRLSMRQASSPKAATFVRPNAVSLDLPPRQSECPERALLDGGHDPARDQDCRQFDQVVEDIPGDAVGAGQRYAQPSTLGRKHEEHENGEHQQPQQGAQARVHARSDV